MKEIHGPKHPKNRDNTPDEELKFLLWKAELNKELLDFWKKLTEQEEN